MEDTRISIVTINRNNADGLRRTMQSVADQDYPSIEYIVIDGASADESVDVIRSHEKSLHYWVSEKDAGIYHAMNKGCAFATGDYILFLNSGDTLVKGALSHVFGNQKYQEDILYGDWVMLFADGAERYITCSDTLNISYFFLHTLPHQSSFIKREVMLSSLYREDYKIVSDWIFFFEKIIIEKCTYRHIHHVVSVFDMAGISNQNHQLPKQERERYLRSVLPDYVFDDYQKMVADGDSCPKCHGFRLSTSYRLGHAILFPFIYLKYYYNKLHQRFP